MNSIEKELMNDCDNATELYDPFPKMPRKLKLKHFGRRKISQKRLAEIVTNGIEACPFCGCRYYHGGENRAVYPEVWVEYYCTRCEKEIGEADNSDMYYHHIVNRY